jgi:hypothetical protein
VYVSPGFLGDEGGLLAHEFTMNLIAIRADPIPAKCRKSLENAFVTESLKGTDFVLHEFRVTIYPMKNVTITVEEDVLEWARIKAARENSSVSRLVGQMLKEKCQQEDAYEVAKRSALQFKSLGVSDGPYLTRDEMYDRAGFR